MTNDSELAQPRDSAPPGDPRADKDAALDALWGQVRERWDEQSVHDTFLGYCSQTDALPQAAARYRSQANDPERAERAEAQLKKLSAVALAQVAALPRTESRERNVVLWLVMIVGVGVLLAWLAQQLW